MIKNLSFQLQETLTRKYQVIIAVSVIFQYLLILNQGEKKTLQLCRMADDFTVFPQNPPYAITS